MNLNHDTPWTWELLPMNYFICLQQHYDVLCTFALTYVSTLKGTGQCRINCYCFRWANGCRLTLHGDLFPWDSDILIKLYKICLPIYLWSTIAELRHFFYNNILTKIQQNKNNYCTERHLAIRLAIWEPHESTFSCCK